ncbi:hypothetical protein ACIP4Q_37790 [Streptomyces massasporeus]
MHRDPGTRPLALARGPRTAAPALGPGTKFGASATDMARTLEELGGLRG